MKPEKCGSGNPGLSSDQSNHTITPEATEVPQMAKVAPDHVGSGVKQENDGCASEFSSDGETEDEDDQLPVAYQSGEPTSPISPIKFENLPEFEIPEEINDFPELPLTQEVSHQKDTFNKLAVHGIVISHLFPRIKFFNKDRDFEFTDTVGSICHFVFSRCNLVFHPNQKEFLWEKAKKWVMVDITRLRSDKCTAIRNAFYGKIAALSISV